MPVEHMRMSLCARTGFIVSMATIGATGIIDCYFGGDELGCSEYSLQMKSFVAKRVMSILVKLRYLWLKLLNCKENDENICDAIDHNFKIIPIIP